MKKKNKKPKYRPAIFLKAAKMMSGGPEFCCTVLKLAGATYDECALFRKYFRPKITSDGEESEWAGAWFGSYSDDGNQYYREHMLRVCAKIAKLENRKARSK